MKKIKIITILLIILLISIVAFGGVYIQVQNRMENQVKKYSYAMDLKGTRNVRLTVNKENKTTIKNKDGNQVDDADDLTDEELAEKSYTKEETPYNSEEILTLENYDKSKKILEKRLKKLNVENYNIALDEQTGDILIEFTENDNTDSVVSNINSVGEFKIIDAETKEILLNNSDIKLVNVMYGSNSSSTTSNGTSVYLNIEFNKQGAKKLEEISKTYTQQESTEDGTSKEDNTADSQETAVADGEQADSTENQTTEKKITMLVDDQEIMSTSFDTPIETGKMQLSVGQASTDKETLQGYADQAANMATILDSGNMPIKYDVEKNEYIASEITGNQLHLAKYVAIGIVIAALIILAIRYKTNGILAAISFIGLFSVLILTLRYTNVILSIEGLCGIAIVLLLEYIFTNKMLQKIKREKKVTIELINKITKETYVEFFMSIIPIFIATITLCFIKWIPISSLGMVMFWGIVLIAIYNVIVLSSLLKINFEKTRG